MIVSIVIPFFNENSIIENNISKIITYFESKYEYEIIIINDSGKKNLILEKIKNNKKNIYLLNNITNSGKGYSIRRGIIKSNGNLILITDADLATPINEFEKLLKYYNENNKIIIGSRSCNDSDIQTKQPIYRIIVGRLYNILIRITLGLKYNDTQCGFKLFNSLALKKIIKYTKSNGFGIDIELIYYAEKLKYKIHEVGVIWSDKKQTSVSVFRDSFIMLIEIFKLRLK